MTWIRERLTYANVVATLALVIAVAGIPAAVAVTKKGSKAADVTAKGKIKAGRVTTDKIADGAITASKLANIDVIQSTSNAFAAQATCPNGERLLSGGARTNQLSTTGPVGAGGSPIEGSWSAFGASGPTTAYALCLR